MFDSIEAALAFFQTEAIYMGFNPNWTQETKYHTPYYVWGGDVFGSMRVSISPKKTVITILSDNANGLKSGGGTACKGEGTTIEDALENLATEYHKYRLRRPSLIDGTKL